VYCEQYDLPVDQCAHCRSGDKIPPRFGAAQQDAVDTAKEIYGGLAVPATYNGTCPACEQPIRRDEDYIVRVAQGWIHEGCRP
jgi:hypothetical protein